MKTASIPHDKRDLKVRVVGAMMHSIPEFGAIAVAPFDQIWTLGDVEEIQDSAFAQKLLADGTYWYEDDIGFLEFTLERPESVPAPNPSVVQ